MPRTTDAWDLFATLPPGRTVVVRHVASDERHAWRAAANASQWAWHEAADDVPSGVPPSVVILAREGAEQTARLVARYSLGGTQSIVVLDRDGHGRAYQAPRTWLAREASPAYGGAGDTKALAACLECWRQDEARAARARLCRLASAPMADACVLLHALVLASLVAGDCGDGAAADAHARAARAVARLLDDAAGRALADLALARVWLARGHAARALAAVTHTASADARVSVVRASLGVRCATAAGWLAAAVHHAAAFDRPAPDDWTRGHEHEARARLAAATGARREAARHLARASAVALAHGGVRRRRRLAALKERLRAEARAPAGAMQERRWYVVDDLLAIFQVCQEHADASAAAAEVAVRLRARLGARRVAILGQGTTGTFVCGSAGAAAVLPDWLPDVIVTAAPRAPAESGGHVAAAAPIASAGAVIGVVAVAWWPGDVPGDEDAMPLLEAAATALGPVVAALADERRAAEAGASLLGDLVGMSRAMQAVREAALRAAAAPFPVLIEGESGCGKELVAHAVHRLSPRRAAPFVALNCAAMSDELVEAELFGHLRGAFTGAVADRAGLFEEADGGTLFLDEVAELSARAQAKLLRVLQNGEVRRVGENRARRVDARVVAATNRPLEGEVRAGRFRADLAYRLDVLRVVVPPLRARLEDLPELAAHLWRGLATRTGCRAVPGAELLAALARYDWPGNVRELQNVLATAMVAAPPRGTVPVAALPPHVRAGGLPDAPLPKLDAARREFEARYVAAALARAGGRAAVAARELGVTRQGLAKLMARLGVTPAGEAPAARTAGRGG